MRRSHPPQLPSANFAANLAVAADRKPRVRLVCLPCAGASASMFHGWKTRLPPWLELLPVELPGHGWRRNEPALDDLSVLVSSLLRELASALEGDFVLVGHSFGALVAYELCTALRRARRPLPQLLVVGGRKAPQVPFARTNLADGDPALLRDFFMSMSGPACSLLRQDPVFHSVLATLRADVRMAETYSYRAEPPLELPILALGGLRDPSESVSAVRAWRERTAVSFRAEFFAGGHFFIAEHEEHVLRHVLQSTAAALEIPLSLALAPDLAT